jgi:hypothetical protein
VPVSVKGTANYHDCVLGVEKGWNHYSLLDQAINMQRLQLTQRVNLYLALGGKW